MRKILLIASIFLAGLMPTFAMAQVFGQNQVILPPFGSNGFVVSTTTGNGAKLSATSTPYFANFFATIGNITKLGNLTSNGLIKTSSGNGTLGTAVNGTDYTLITAKTCNAGDFVSDVTAAGIFTCSTPSVSGGSSFPFTPTTYAGVTVNATSTGLWLKATSPFSLIASSTFATNASSTQLTNSGSFWLPSLTSGGLAVDANGLVYKGATTTAGTGLTYSGNAFNVNTTQSISALSNLTTNALVVTSGGNGTLGAYAGTSCTNQFVRSLSVLGAATCATVGASDVSLAALTAGTGLTSAGTYTGATARTFSLDLTNANAWTGRQNFANASSSLFSITGTGYFGGTATSTVDSTGKFTFVTAPVISTLTGVLVGNGASALTAASTQTCTNQFVRAMSNSYVATCATVGAADVSLANLTATDASLTFSGTYNGSTARTIGLNLGNANTWTALQQFNGNASTTKLSVYSNFYAGATATTTIDSAGNTSVAGTLNVTGKTTLGAASTTDATASNSLGIPHSSNPAPTSPGYITQSDNSPYQLHIGNNSGGTTVFDPRPAFIMTVSSTTALTGTTTSPVFVFPKGMTVTNWMCTSQPGGSGATVAWQYANPTAYTTVGPTYMIASTTPGIMTISSNNTPTVQATSTLAVGNVTSSPTSVSCSFYGNASSI